MIHTAHVLNDLTHEEAYARGFTDAAAGDPRLSRQADDAHRTLTSLLDRIEGIQAWEVPPVFDGEEE